MPAKIPRQRPRNASGLISVLPQQSDTQDRFERSETSVHSMDSGSTPRPFPFFKLPAELRNEIYRLVVITGRSLIVQDMHGWGIEEIRGNYIHQSRSTYLATDHVCGLYSWFNFCFIPCSLHTIDPRPMRTTYALGAPGAPLLVERTTTKSLDLKREDKEGIAMTMTMLSLNKESREEVAFIFYGENSFHFNTMSSLVPFMKDRTEETRKYVKSIRLILTVDGRNWDAIFTEYGRPASWNTAFSTLAKLPHVNLKQLCVQINDKEAKVLMYGLNFRSRSMLWLHKLSKIENLEMLGVRYDVGELKPLPQQPNHWRRGPADTAAHIQTEQELWRFLAPKMLRKEADDHSPEALQKRRICDS